MIMRYLDFTKHESVKTLNVSCELVSRMNIWFNPPKPFMVLMNHIFDSLLCQLMSHKLMEQQCDVRLILKKIHSQLCCFVNHFILFCKSTKPFFFRKVSTQFVLIPFHIAFLLTTDQHSKLTIFSSCHIKIKVSDDQFAEE